MIGLSSRVVAALTLAAVALVCWAILAWLTPELLPPALGGQPEAALSAPAPRLPAARSRASLAAAIASQLATLGVGADDIIRAEPLTLSTPAGPWTVETVELYLPPGLAPRYVAGALQALPAPGAEALSWTERVEDDLRTVLEARLDRLPAHVIELTPWIPAPSGRLAPRPPELALLITGAGGAFDPVDRLLRLETPLTLAVEPYTPWALEWAEQAQLEGKEVLVDWREAPAADATAFDRLSAVPYARGVWAPPWLGGTPALTRLLDLVDVNALAVASSGQRVVEQAQERGLLAGRALALDAPGRRDLSRELARLQAMAVRDGAAIGAIEPRPEDLGILITWLIGLRRDGFEPVLVSDALHRLADAG